MPTTHPALASPVVAHGGPALAGPVGGTLWPCARESSGGTLWPCARESTHGGAPVEAADRRVLAAGALQLQRHQDAVAVLSLQRGHERQRLPCPDDRSARGLLVWHATGFAEAGSPHASLATY